LFRCVLCGPLQCICLELFRVFVVKPSGCIHPTPGLDT
jgi:hypothetical protein